MALLLDEIPLTSFATVIASYYSVSLKIVLLLDDLVIDYLATLLTKLQDIEQRRASIKCNVPIKCTNRLNSAPYIGTNAKIAEIPSRKVIQMWDKYPYVCSTKIYIS